MRVRAAALVFAASLGCAAPSARALDIVLTNDDGFESSLTYAVYQRLAAAGHRVLIAAPVVDQSGRGGSADFLRPIAPLAAASRAGCARPGAPGVGDLALGDSAVDTTTCPADARVMWVAGTPVASALYGIDVAARAVFGRRADLVISGPNFGNNTGLVNNASGTFNAALIAINRGVPAIAVSVASPGRYRSLKDLKSEDPEFEIAALVVRLVAMLEQPRCRRAGPLLPVGVGLNVNVPAFAAGTATALPVRLSHVGTAPSATPVFSTDLCADPFASNALGEACAGDPKPMLAGVTLVPYGTTVPGELSSIPDTEPLSEQNVVAARAISISVIGGNHDGAEPGDAAARRKLHATLECAIRRRG